MSHQPTPIPAVYGLLARFEDAESLLQACRATRQAGYVKIDAYAPYPLHGLSEALGLGRTAVPLVVLIGAILGATGGFGMLWYSSVIDYPLNIAGRPFNSWQAFIPITFEMAILGAALAAVVGMIALNGLPQPYHPVFNIQRFARASSDEFFLCIESDDPQYDLEKTRQFMLQQHCAQLWEVPA